MSFSASVESGELHPALPLRICWRVSGSTSTPSERRCATICCPLASVQHRAARQVAEGEVARRVVEVDVLLLLPEHARGQELQRVGDQGVDPLRPVEAVRSGQPGVAAVREVVHPTPVGDPVARELQVPAEAPAHRREVEHVEQGPGVVREPPVPVVRRAHHAVPEAEPRDRELDRHGRYVGRQRVRLDQLAPVGEHVVEDVLLDDPRQEVVPDQPLVVQRHRLACPPELLPGRHRRGQPVDDPVVEPDHGEVGLGDDQVLVVARVGDQRRPLLHDATGADPRQVVADLLAVGAGPDGVAGLQVQPVVLVELRGSRVGRPGAVQGVQVEARRAGLEQLRRRDGVTELDLGDVHGQVVVDELAEVGVAGRHVALRLVPERGHRVGELPCELGP